MNTAATTNSRKQQQIPQAPNLQPPPSPKANFQDQAWAEEAARAAQRHFDMAAEILRLTTELEDWRRRALGAESELKRAAERETILQQQIDTRNSALNQERDIFRETVVKLSTQFGSASQIILDAHKLMDEVLGRKPQVNLASLGEAIEADTADTPPAKDPIPEFLTAGPRS